MEERLNQSAQDLLHTVRPTTNIVLLVLLAFGGSVILWITLGWFVVPTLIAMFSGTGVIITIVLFGLTWLILFVWRYITLRATVYRFYGNRVEYSESFLTREKKPCDMKE